jgi:glycosyltransferase involved in cell wall biosynthesis
VKYGFFMMLPEDKKKILIVGPLPPTVGGITTFITDILESDLAQKYRLIPFDTSRLVLKNKIPTIRDYRILSLVNTLDLLKSILITLRNLLMFPATLLRVKPNLVHVHTPSYWVFWENSLYILTSRMYGIKVILHIHGGAFDKFYNNSNFLMQNLIRIIMGFPQKIVALSSYWKNFFTQIIGIRTKVVIINNGVVSSRFSPQYARKNKKTNEVEVLFVGGMEAERKGIFTLIKAIPIIIKKASNTSFTFIGKSEMTKVRSLSKRLKVEEYVKILGQVPEKEKILHFCSSDIFVLPTYAEGLPITLLEAMAAGLPIISTPVGAIPEVITEGKNGFLIEPGDHKALAEDITILARNKKLRREMGANNIERIIKEYDQSIVIRKLDNEYNRVLRNGHPRA